MNKNWLYRILAIALVAMLALPVFAMAEETTGAIELGADELIAKETYDLADGAFDEDGDKWDAGTLTLDMNSSRDHTIEMDLADATVKGLFEQDSKNRAKFRIDVELENVEEGSKYPTYSSSKTGVATAKRMTGSPNGTINILKTGTTVIKITAKNIDGKTVTRKITLKISDSETVKKFKFYTDKVGTAAFEKDDERKGTYTVVLGSTFQIHAAAYDKDGDVLDQVAVALNSKTDSVVKLDEDNGPYAGNFTDPRYYTATAKKVGTSTIEATAPGKFTNLKGTLKIKVKANSALIKSDKDLKQILKWVNEKHDKIVKVGVRKIEFTKIGWTNGAVDPTKCKIKVTYFVANGTKSTYSNIKDFTASATWKKYETADAGTVSQNPNEKENVNIIALDSKTSKLSKSWKKGALSYFEVSYDGAKGEIAACLDSDGNIIDFTDKKLTDVIVDEYKFTIDGQVFTAMGIEEE